MAKAGGLGDQFQKYLAENWKSADEKYRSFGEPNKYGRFPKKTLRQMAELVTPEEEEYFFETLDRTESKMKAATEAGIPYALAGHLVEEQDKEVLHQLGAQETRQLMTLLRGLV